MREIGTFSKRFHPEKGARFGRTQSSSRPSRPHLDSQTELELTGELAKSPHAFFQKLVDAALNNLWLNRRFGISDDILKIEKVVDKGIFHIDGQHPLGQ